MNFGEGEEPRVLACDQRGRRAGAPRPSGTAGRQPPPEAVPGAARRTRRVTSRSSVASTCATDGATTTSTSAIRRSWSSTTRTTASARRGTTCSSSCAVRPSTTWRGRSPNAGAIPTRSTPATRCGRCCTGSPTIPTRPGALPPSRPAPPDGPLAVQVLRTYPARRRAYPFAPEGERSIARAYLKAFSRRAPPRLPRGPVPLVAGRDRGAARRAGTQPRAAGRGRDPALSRSRRRDLRGGEPRSVASACSTRCTTSATSASRCTTSRTTRARRSTCTRRCASSTTSGWRSAPTTSTADRGRTTPSSRAS